VGLGGQLFSLIVTHNMDPYSSLPGVVRILSFLAPVVVSAGSSLYFVTRKPTRRRRRAVKTAH
jgi:hypothetical protein